MSIVSKITFYPRMVLRYLYELLIKYKIFNKFLNKYWPYDYWSSNHNINPEL